MTGAIDSPDPPKTMIQSSAGPDLAKQGILIDLLSTLVQLREPDDFWTQAVHKLKWILECDRVDLALFDSPGDTYALKTIFESRSDVPFFSAVNISREAGCVAGIANSPAVILQTTSGGIPAESVVDPDLEGGSLAQILVVHLRADGKSIGALCFGSAQANAYGHREVELSVTVAAHLSVVFARIQNLRTVLRELEAFSFTVAHDLRAPLRSIHQRAELLLNDESASLSVDGQQSLRRIIGSADQMDRMISGLIAFSRLGPSDIVMGRISLHACITRVLSELEEENSASRAEISLEGEFGEVIGNELLIKQILTNLLTNALKFTSPGARPWIRIRTESHDHRVRLWVEDHGIGMTPAETNRVFRVFERIHPEGRYAGAGIGLAIVHRAVERMGGAVGVESEPGRGSRFWVEMVVP